MDGSPDVHDFRHGAGESVVDLFQLDISDNLPGVALSNPVGGVDADAIELEGLGTNFDKLFVWSLVVYEMEGGSRGKNCDSFHKN